MTTLITGSSGLIGNAIADELHDRGESIVGYDIEPDEVPGDNVVVTGDIAEYSDFEEAVDEHQPDQIAHLAAMVGSTTNRNPTQALQINGVGTDNVFQAALEHGVDRVVWSSTLGVYGPASSYSTDSVSEATVTPAAYNVYPESSYYRAIKQLNEYQSRMYDAEYDVESHLIRPSVVFGPRRDRSWIGRFIDEAVEEGESTIERPPDARLSLVYMTDVADLFAEVLLAEAPDYHAYNTGGNAVSAQEVADIVERKTGGSVTCNKDAPPKASPYEIGNERAVNEFDYQVTPIEDAIEDYVDRIS